MTSNAKICPGCQMTNAAQNLSCLRCENSLIHVDFAPNFSEKYAGQLEERNYFLEELLTPTLFVCGPLSILCALLALATLGTPLTPVFFAAGMILGATPFFPGDPVGDFFRKRIEELQKKAKS